jgi:Ca-activated chloride channel family protein
VKSSVVIALVATLIWWELWFTPDQQGQRLQDRGEYQRAAHTYRDPMRQGFAWYRAGEFAKAEQAFARIATPEAEYNRGNCLIMQGKYELAVERYNRALKVRPNWEDAQVNRNLAIARAKLVKKEGGEMGDQKIGADEIVFDKKKSGGQELNTESGEELPDASMQALWLRRVQTKPADFLKSKFAYQLTFADSSEASP